MFGHRLNEKRFVEKMISEQVSEVDTLLIPKRCIKDSSWLAEGSVILIDVVFLCLGRFISRGVVDITYMQAGRHVNNRVYINRVFDRLLTTFVTRQLCNKLERNVIFFVDVGTVFCRCINEILIISNFAITRVIGYDGTLEVLDEDVLNMTKDVVPIIRPLGVSEHRRMDSKNIVPHRINRAENFECNLTR
jgi:hypothetical protein